MSARTIAASSRKTTPCSASATAFKMLSKSGLRVAGVGNCRQHGQHQRTLEHRLAVHLGLGGPGERRLKSACLSRRVDVAVSPEAWPRLGCRQAVKPEAEDARDRGH